jgi:hypothetical protein
MRIVRIRDLLGSYNHVFYPMAGLAAIGIAIAAIFLKRERPAVDSPLDSTAQP